MSSRGQLHSVQGSGIEFNEELRKAYAELEADPRLRRAKRKTGKETRGKNIAENQFARRMIKGRLLGKGWKVTKRGWPDFFCFNEETGEILLVEVKPDKGTPLMDSQLKIARALKAYGVPVRRWSPDTGLQEIPDAGAAVIRPADRLSRRRIFK